MKYLARTPLHLDKFATAFTVDHSKFIHGSWLLASDLGREATINGLKWTIMGLWDIQGYRRDILIKSEKGAFAIADSRVVSEGLGYTNMRNLVTGKEHTTFKFYASSEIETFKKVEDATEQEEGLDDLPEEQEPDTDEDQPEVWKKIDAEANNPDDDTDEDEDEVDPLVKALREDITDSDF